MICFLNSDEYNNIGLHNEIDQINWNVEFFL